jgi:hypothetical protein
MNVTIGFEPEQRHVVAAIARISDVAGVDGESLSDAVVAIAWRDVRGRALADDSPATREPRHGRVYVRKSLESTRIRRLPVTLLR